MRRVHAFVIVASALAAALLLFPAAAGAQANFIRGDCNIDGGIDIGDPVFILAELFSSGPSSTCRDACDLNDDSGLDIADAVAALAFLFSAGAPPPAPYPACGADPTADALPCILFPLCPTGPELCGNGIDDDADGDLDCADPDCVGDPACTAPPGGLVINEVDYDQPATDTAEFIEIHNSGANPYPLAGITLLLVNGATSTPYASIDLSPVGSLPAGGYLVVHTPAVTVAAGALTLPFAGMQDQIQNGAPDAIAIVDLGSVLVLDALSYEGAVGGVSLPGFPGTLEMVEGTATPAVDDSVTAGLVLIRSPNGADTNNAAADWTTSTPPTPGSANP